MTPRLSRLLPLPFIATICFLPFVISAQDFTPLQIELEPMRYATLQWGDYDSDGDLDLLAAGASYIGAKFENSRPATIVYRNDGNADFAIADTSMIGIQQGSAAWGDFDNDGDLDVFVNGQAEAGIGYEPVARVYRNEGSDTFIEAAVLDALDYPFGTWGDYTNDGYLDLILTGDRDPDVIGLDPVSAQYRNDQNGGFVRNDSALIGVAFGGVAFADYDNDSDLDIVLTGLSVTQGYISTIYQNNNGYFENINPGFLGLLYSKSDWADFDNDGDYDVVIGGQEGGIAATRARFYRNDGDGEFSPVYFTTGDTLPPLGRPSFDWGDYDNDGDPDLLMTGQIGILATRYSAIFRNEGNTSFTALTGDLVPVRTGDAKWGDYDNDGDLDIIICGTDTSNIFGEFITRIYQNNLITPNSAPLPPAVLSSTVDEGSVHLSWTAGSDAETPGEVLTYNLRIGSAPGLSDVQSPMSIEASGYRKLPQRGNTNMNREWHLNDLPDGTYYWSVQSVDGSLAGSPFSMEESFVVGEVTGVDDIAETRPDRFSLSQNYPNPFNPSTSVEFGLRSAERVRLKIYDTSGRHVKSLVDAQMDAGMYQVVWDGTNENGKQVASGVYLYQLTAGEFARTRRMLLLR